MAPEVSIQIIMKTSQKVTLKERKKHTMTIGKKTRIIIMKVTIYIQTILWIQLKNISSTTYRKKIIFQNLSLKWMRMILTQEEKHLTTGRLGLFTVSHLLFS